MITFFDLSLLIRDIYISSISHQMTLQTANTMMNVMSLVYTTQND